jgi:hypothetical protein
MNLAPRRPPIDDDGDAFACSLIGAAALFAAIFYMLTAR